MSSRPPRAVADTGPLVAAANRRDRGHALAAELVSRLGRQLLVPALVAVEVDQLLRSRVSRQSAQAFLAAVDEGEHTLVPPTARLFRRAVEIDRTYADLDLGIVDASVMALAEQERAPILTFDFEHFRATRPRRGFWRLVVDESRYLESTS